MGEAEAKAAKNNDDGHGSKEVVTMIPSTKSTPIRSPATKKSRTTADEHDGDEKMVDVDGDGLEIAPRNLMEKFDGCQAEPTSPPKDVTWCELA